MSLSKSLKGLLLCVILIIPDLSGAQSIQAGQYKSIIDSLASKNLFSGSILVGVGSSVEFYYSAGYSSRKPDQSINEHTTFEIASLTKQFTAALILKLYKEERISLHDPLGKHLKWYPNSYKNEVTIHQLLTHQSGIPNYTDLPNWPFLATQDFEKVNFATQLFANKPLQFTPGSDFSYSNSNYYLLGLIAEEITQKSYGTLLREHIFSPLGMNNSGTLAERGNINNLALGYEKLSNGYIEKAPNQDYSTAFSVSGIYSTPRDLFIWSKALTEHTILPDSMLKLMKVPYSNNYGYGLVISFTDLDDIAIMIRNPFSETNENIKNKLKIVWHWGSNPGYNTLFLKIPEKQISIIFLENLTQLENNTPTLIPSLTQKIILDILD